MTERSELRRFGLLIGALFKGWIKVGKTIGRINIFLILAIIFWFVLTPMGFIMRRFKTNTERFAFKWNNESYWIKRMPGNPKEEMKRMF